MMNTVANNIQLCITSQSRKLNSLAFILECLIANSVTALCITSLGHKSADPGGDIPPKKFLLHPSQ